MQRASARGGNQRREALAPVAYLLDEQLDDGGSRSVRFALAQTAAWLTDGIEPGDGGEVSYDGPDSRLAETDSVLGRLRYALPPVSFAGGPADWARPPGPWGTDSARWV